MTQLDFTDNPIGEADIELMLKMDVSQKIVNELFDQIDFIKDKEIPYGIFVLLAVVGSVSIVAGTIMFEWFVNQGTSILVIYGVGFVLCILFTLAVYACFLQTAGKNAHVDCKRLAQTYKDITEERRLYRGMRKTFNRMLDLKTNRSIKERNNSYLRAINLLRLESLRFFTTDFDEKTFQEMNIRIQEIILLSA